MPARGGLRAGDDVGVGDAHVYRSGAYARLLRWMCLGDRGGLMGTGTLLFQVRCRHEGGREDLLSGCGDSP